MSTLHFRKGRETVEMMVRIDTCYNRNQRIFHILGADVNDALNSGGPDQRRFV